MKIKYALVVAALCLSGCGSGVPTCGTPGLHPDANCRTTDWNALNNMIPDTSNYSRAVYPTTQPVQLQPQRSIYGNSQSYMINTPNGMVQRTCRDLGNGNTYCY
jgi:hypothetical protein